MSELHYAQDENAISPRRRVALFALRALHWTWMLAVALLIVAGATVLVGGVPSMLTQGGTGNRGANIAGALALWIFVRPLSYVGLFIGLSLVVGGGRWAYAARQRRAQVVLGYVDSAMRRHLPLRDVLETAAATETPVVARRLRAIVEDLGYGTGPAILAGLPELPAADAEVLIAAERNGTLPQAVARIHARRQVELPAATSLPSGLPVGVTFVLMAMVLALVLIFVMPKYQQIFKDFGVAMPGVTQALLGGVWWVTGQGWILPVAALVGLLAFCRMLVSSMASMLGQKPLPLPVPRWAVQFCYRLPLLTRPHYHRSLADALDTLADGIDMQRALPDAIAAVPGMSLHPDAAASLSHWRDAVLGGLGVVDAARRSGLPRLVVGTLETGLSGGPDQISGALRFAASHYRRRAEGADKLRRELAGQALLLLLGAVVAFVALSLFTPMVTLIQTVSVSTGLVNP
jgi:type II secretory pathway component PulF